MRYTLGAQLTALAFRAMTKAEMPLARALFLELDDVARYLEAPEVAPYPVRLFMGAILSLSADTEAQQLGKLLAQATQEDLARDGATLRERIRDLDREAARDRVLRHFSDSLHRHPRLHQADTLSQVGVDLDGFIDLLLAAA